MFLDRVDETRNTISRKKCLNCFRLAQMPEPSTEDQGRRARCGGCPRMSILNLESPISGISTGAFQLSWQVSSSSTFKPAWACFHLPCVLVAALPLHARVPVCLALLLSFPWTLLTLIALRGHNRFLPWHHMCSDVRMETEKERG